MVCSLFFLHIIHLRLSLICFEQVFPWLVRGKRSLELLLGIFFMSKQRVVPCQNQSSRFDFLSFFFFHMFFIFVFFNQMLFFFPPLVVYAIMRAERIVGRRRRNAGLIAPIVVGRTVEATASTHRHTFDQRRKRTRRGRPRHDLPEGPQASLFPQRGDWHLQGQFVRRDEYSPGGGPVCVPYLGPVVAARQGGGARFGY